MKFESGTHRVQRVPQTETQGRVHTSAATVLPEAEEFDIEINPADVRVDFFLFVGTWRPIGKYNLFGGSIDPYSDRFGCPMSGSKISA